MRRYIDAIHRAVVVLLVLALMLIFALSAVTSCDSRQVGDGISKSGAQASNADGRTSADKPARPGIQKSAGACIYGEPEKIEVYIGGDVRTLRPGALVGIFEAQ